MKAGIHNENLYLNINHLRLPKSSLLALFVVNKKNFL